MAITNAEKFKTAKERTIAFNKYCKCNCADCKTFEAKNHQHTLNCAFVWLEMEAAKEKPLPCPFCGSAAVVRHNIHDDGQPHEYYVECGDPNCKISPRTYSYVYKSKDEAIAVWNKRA